MCWPARVPCGTHAVHCLRPCSVRMAFETRSPGLGAPSGRVISRPPPHHTSATLQLLAAPKQPAPAPLHKAAGQSPVYDKGSKDQEEGPAPAAAAPPVAAAATPPKVSSAAEGQHHLLHLDAAGAVVLAAMTPVAARARGAGAAASEDGGGALSPPYAVVVGGRPPALRPPSAVKQPQLQLRDSIFAGVLEPAAPGTGGGGAAFPLLPPSVTPRGDQGPLPGLPLVSPTTLDPLALLRMSMLNPEFPAAPTPPTGFEGKTAPPSVLNSTGILSPLSMHAPGASPGGVSPGGGGAAAGGGGEGLTWQRRRRVSAVLREELADVAKALEDGLPQVGAARGLLLGRCFVALCCLRCLLATKALITPRLLPPTKLATRAPQMPRTNRPQPSALRGPESSGQLQLIPTPSGLGSGAATPGMCASPLPGIVMAGGGCSSNVHHPWQQQQQRLMQQQGSPRRAKRPADLAAEQLAARVLAAHKVRVLGVQGCLSRQPITQSRFNCTYKLAACLCQHALLPPVCAPLPQGNWVSALHKLASAVGQQLKNARDAPLALAHSPPDHDPHDQLPDQQHTSAVAPQLPEPELAAREARLKRVLVRGTRAARVIAAQGGLPASAPPSGAATPVSAQQLQPQDQQQQGVGGLSQAAGFGAARQLQLGPEQLPGGILTDASPFAPAPGAMQPGGGLPQAWNVGLNMPHLRPRPGPSRLAHQSSLNAWAAAQNAFPHDGMMAAAGLDSMHMAASLAPMGGVSGAGGAPTGAAAAAAMAAAVGDASALEAAAAISDAAIGEASLGDGALDDPMLQLQQLHLQHQVQLAMLGAAPIAAPAAAASAPPQMLMPHHQPQAAHYDEPIISLKEARREARSRSATPGAGNTPRAGAGAAPALAFGPAVAAAAAAAAASASAMEVDGIQGGGAAAAAPQSAGAGNGHPEEEDDDHDPIAAQLAGTQGDGGEDAGALVADLEADFDVDLRTAGGRGGDAAGAAAHGPAGGMVPLPLPLPHQAQLAHLQQQQQQQAVAAALAFQQQLMQQDGGMVAYAAAPMQPPPGSN
jgi:hypothetical protein